MANRARYSTQEAVNLLVMGKNGLKTIIDEASSTVTYIGYAEQGASLGASIWLIKKIDEDVSGDTMITWAPGAKFDQEWDERTSLSYS